MGRFGGNSADDGKLIELGAAQQHVGIDYQNHMLVLPRRDHPIEETPQAVGEFRRGADGYSRRTPS